MLTHLHRLKIITHLHRLKIIHRDLKPQNCLLADAGGRLTIKLCDE
jgi:serine/threonine protein kinase